MKKINTKKYITVLDGIKYVTGRVTLHSNPCILCILDVTEEVGCIGISKCIDIMSDKGYVISYEKA